MEVSTLMDGKMEWASAVSDVIEVGTSALMVLVHQRGHVCYCFYFGVSFSASG